jgi:hypothetical protein
MATGFSSEIGELKIRLQAMEQQAQLRDGKHVFLDYVNNDSVVYSFILFINTTNYKTGMSLEVIYMSSKAVAFFFFFCSLCYML